jgi:hypothetical protein
MYVFIPMYKVPYRYLIRRLERGARLAQRTVRARSTLVDELAAQGLAGKC